MGQQLETMLRTCAAPCRPVGIRCAGLGFRLIHSQIPASGAEPKLKQLQGHAQMLPVSCCICSKHGLSLAGIPALGSLEWQILKTMLRTYAAVRCVGGPAPSICSKHGFHLLAPVAPGSTWANN